MIHKRLREAFQFLKNTPFHPQWLAYLKKEQNFKEIGKKARGLILDIGCGDKTLRSYISPQASYRGLDYYSTGKKTQHVMPDIWGDAQKLPVADRSIDSVILVNVLDDLPDPDQCVKEISRILKPHGVFVLQAPFLYPLHDSPFDFHRWTLQGLRNLVTKYGFTILEEKSFGQPTETAAFLTNIAFSKAALNMLGRNNPLAFPLILSLAVLVPIINITGWAFVRISPEEPMMPMSHRLVCSKPPSQA